MTAFVHLLATLDTKGQEAAFVAELLRGYGCPVRVVDCGTGGPPQVPADVSREALFAAASRSVPSGGDRGAAVAAVAEAAAAFVVAAHARGELAGVIALGGSAGSTIGSAAMRALPLGVPKVLVSTLASGQVRHYLGDKDILLLGSIVDIAGLNRISRTTLGAAARAMAGLVRFPPVEVTSDRPLIAASMFGVTTPCVQQARAVLEQAGFEVLVFHATGAGGQALESLVDDGVIAGVLDVTTTELADELIGGVLTAGPSRLTAAGRRGIPQVVAPGALDMVNFHAWETVPERFRGRTLHRHNASVTLMRTTPEECAALGAELARKLRSGRGPRALFLPRRGVSALDATGAPFDDPAARAALAEAAKRELAGSDVEVFELDQHINDEAFARAMAERLLQMLRLVATKSPA